MTRKDDTSDAKLAEERKKEARRLVEHIALLCQYWTDLPTGAEASPAPLPDTPEKLRETIKWRVEGIAHSILVAIDGGAVVGPYHLVPVDKVEDAKEAIDVLGWDIALDTELHDLFADIETPSEPQPTAKL